MVKKYIIPVNVDACMMYECASTTNYKSDHFRFNSFIEELSNPLYFWLVKNSNHKIK